MSHQPTDSDGQLPWESGGSSRIPFAAYTSDALHRRELDRFFYRAHWCYVGLEAEIPKPGDFKRSAVGERSVIMVRDLDEALPLVDAIAPEHLEIASGDGEKLAAGIRNAGAIFLGAHTPEAIGDYVGGSNHVLPTARSARFSSGLGVLDFMKRTSILKCGPDQLRALGPAAIALGEAEGLDAHARSVAMRFNR